MKIGCEKKTLKYLHFLLFISQSEKTIIYSLFRHPDIAKTEVHTVYVSVYQIISAGICILIKKPALQDILLLSYGAESVVFVS